MKIIILYLILIISFTSCINADYEEIQTFRKTEFNVNKDHSAYFKYQLKETKGPIGLHFLLANLYTVEVVIYKTLENPEPIIQYFPAKEPFKEIDTTDFDEYVYIEIKETFEYFYKDYITIYNPNEKIELSPNEPLTINRFLSNNKYEITFSAREDILLMYNTLNSESNKRIITIIRDNSTIIDKGDESFYKLPLEFGTYVIYMENYAKKDDETPNQDFSLIFYEKTNRVGFNKLTKNEIMKTNYIYNNDVQQFLYYVDISNEIEYNTINFKLFYQYYPLNDSSIKFYSKILVLPQEITDEDLEDNIPTENTLPSAYDSDSDEYYRLYFHDENNADYKYLLVGIDVTDKEYYAGSFSIDVSLGNQVESHDLTDREYNKIFKIKPTLKDYIPNYFQLILNPDEKYLLTSQHQDISLFIIGDLLDGENKINTNYLINNNEIIILSNIEKLTVRLFGSTDKEITFNVEKVQSSQLIYAENDRNNVIFEITEDNCKSGEQKYILGTYDYEKYTYEIKSADYYATSDSGEFSVYYNYRFNDKEDESMFPSKESELQKLNEKITLQKNLDLFTVKCKTAGIFSIRPIYKSFVEKDHIIEQNTINQLLLFDYTEMVQLTTPLGQKQGTIYFSILSLDKEPLNITSDTPGVFDEETISDKPFIGKVDLSKYKMDQLAIKVKSATLDKHIEVIEVLLNEANEYKQLIEGDNNNIKTSNVYFELNNTISKLNITLGKLEKKKIAYAVIRSAINDNNYIASASNYSNSTEVEIKSNNELINVKNIYEGKEDEMKPYIFLVLSVFDKEESYEYNINVDLKEKKDNPPDKGGMPVFVIILIAIGSLIVLGLIVLIVYKLLKKRRNSINIDNNKIETLCPENANNQAE